MTEPLDHLLHRLWTKAVGKEAYDKNEWKALEDAIYRLKRPETPSTRALRSDLDRIDAEYGRDGDLCHFCCGVGHHRMLTRDDDGTVRCQAGDVRALAKRMRELLAFDPGLAGALRAMVDPGAAAPGEEIGPRVEQAVRALDAFVTARIEQDRRDRSIR